MERSQTTLKKPHLMFQPSWDVVPATGSWPPPQLEEDLALKGSGKIASGSKRQWTDEVKTAFVIIRLVALACSCLLDLSVCFHPSISSRTRSARALLLVWCTTLVERRVLALSYCPCFRRIKLCATMSKSVDLASGRRYRQRRAASDECLLTPPSVLRWHKTSRVELANNVASGKQYHTSYYAGFNE